MPDSFCDMPGQMLAADAKAVTIISDDPSSSLCRAGSIALFSLCLCGECFCQHVGYLWGDGYQTGRVNIMVRTLLQRKEKVW